MIALLLGAGLALGGMQIQGSPQVAVETIILVLDGEDEPLAGQTVRVVHRPGLHGEEEQAVGITDGLGRVRWTPARGGPTRVRAERQELWITVARPPPPSTAILLALLILAGLLGLGYGLRSPRHTLR